jgi:hypothetical protein
MYINWERPSMDSWGEIEYEDMTWTGTGKWRLEPEKAGRQVHCKKRLPIFPPSPVGMSRTKHSLARNNFIIHGQGEFVKLHPVWRQENL